MSAFRVCLNAILPIFFMMALGVIARRLGAIKREEIPKLNSIAFNFFVPFTLFYSIYNSELSHAVQPKLIGFTVLGVLCVYGLCLAYVLLTEHDASKRAVKIQGLYRSNSVIIGLPLAAQLSAGADLGPAVVLIALVVPISAILAVITFEVFSGKKPQLSRILLDILKNPLIISTLVGVAALLLNIRLPEPLESAVRQINNVTNPMLLFLLGAFFELGGLRQYMKDVIEVCIGRLIVIPAILLSIAWFAGIRGVAFTAMIAIFGSATSTSSFTMVQQMGGDDVLAGDIVVASSALCCVTVLGWSVLFKTLGAF